MIVLVALCCHTAAVKHDRRVGALLILVGGLLEAVRLLVFVSVSLPMPVAVYAVPSICIGGGLILLGVSIRGRGRPPLLAAGVLNLATVVVNAIQVAAHSPLGPGPSQLAEFAKFAAVVVAATLLLSDSSLRGPARWAISLPAACIVLFLVGLFLPPLPWARVDVLPAIGFAIAGVLLSRPAAASHAGSADPLHHRPHPETADPADPSSPAGTP